MCMFIHWEFEYLPAISPAFTALLEMTTRFLKQLINACPVSCFTWVVCSSSEVLSTHLSVKQCTPLKVGSVCVFLPIPLSERLDSCQI